jgi:hypothetical protein
LFGLRHLSACIRRFTPDFQGQEVLEIAVFVPPRISSPVVCVIRPTLEIGEMERLLYWRNFIVQEARRPSPETWVVLRARYSVGVTLHTFRKTLQKYAGSL